MEKECAVWPDRRIIDLVGLEYPIIQAPMIGPKTDLPASVAAVGGLGSLACAALLPEQVRVEVDYIRARTSRPINLNFFCHTPSAFDSSVDAAWRARLAPYYRELGLDPDERVAMTNRAPFDAVMGDLVAELRPKVASFHFGLPDSSLLQQVKDAGCLVFASATTVEEARWLEAHGVDAVIAQGAEAGGHRGMFLTSSVASQVGTFALVPQIVDAVQVPVIAAGGVADARGIVAAFALGAAAVQIGTAYLRCPEARIPAPHLAALRNARDDGTVLTNILTGRPARGIANRIVRELGPLNDEAPAFPLAAPALQPLRTKAEAQGSGDFSPLWCGQAAGLAREAGAAELTRTLAAEALAMFRTIGR